MAVFKDALKNTQYGQLVLSKAYTYKYACLGRKDSLVASPIELWIED